ncbi:putative killer cell immunoglobulin-like receptor-like protein KIR3DX1 [Saimiri boliviensis]|uniref:putative killer cell immunoglobulin-like receptor-like protein KIR3DX1 n=1 Tax=Saimiri boliviensis TaxID=27679 RepID=UPI003D77FD69
MAPKLIAVLCLGAPDKLSLSARPSPVVPLGGRVTLSCDSPLRFVTFTIYKTSGTQDRELHTGHSSNFTISPVTPGHAGTYRCSGSFSHTSQWSAHSKSLTIVVTGAFRKPSISAHPSALVAAGARVTVRCHSELAFDDFILYKEGHTQHSQELDEGMEAGTHYVEAVFRLGPVTPAHTGAYRCCGSFSHSRYECSAPSDPLEIVITGKHKKPSLSTQVGPMMGLGENVTLFCISEISFDRYHLWREGAPHCQWLSGGQRHGGAFQANFSMGLATPAHGGTYRCYGSFNASPYEWSAPSEPLHLSVTGIPQSTFLSPMEPTPETGSHPHDYTEGNLIRMGVAVLVLLVLGVFLLESCTVRKKEKHPICRKKRTMIENKAPFRTTET